MKYTGKDYMKLGFRLALAGIGSAFVVGIVLALLKFIPEGLKTPIETLLGVMLTAFAAERAFGMTIPELALLGKKQHPIVEYLGKGIKIWIIDLVAMIPMILYFILVIGGSIATILAGPEALLAVGLPLLLIGFIVGFPIAWYLTGYLAVNYAGFKK